MDQQQTEDELHKQVADQLVIATPEWWDYATLELNFSSQDGIDSCQHSIFNPHFPSDCVEAPEELHDATRRLVLHYKQSGSMWKSAVYEVWQEEKPDWKFSVKFEY